MNKNQQHEKNAPEVSVILQTAVPPLYVAKWCEKQSQKWINYTIVDINITRRYHEYESRGRKCKILNPIPVAHANTYHWYRTNI